ncbi:hypothetical protein PENTCL1PPCAC_12182 [Pristionchus entomophagus]|uniref:MARVEL domain-containing protein n=1 Tax=Pristionchus entomophagus TaxID=358040 RepID=A0AAV5T4W0_9BILA|nr:hypothetical protein PENTCL1PPCAC_12182 [Pristionchus entomophagus]
MHFSAQLILSSVVKILIALCVIAVICLIDPSYVTAYININYEIVIIYVFSALTLLYCIVSIVMYFIMSRKEGGVGTNQSIAEVIFSLAQVMAWLIVLGIAGTISQRTIIESGEAFGWIGALSGVIVGCFLLIAGVFILNVINEKILSKERLTRYSEKSGYAPGQSY